MWPHVIEIQIKTDVSIEIAITRVTGIAFVLAPDLPRGIVVATECGNSILRVNWRECAVTRTGSGVKNSVRFQNKPADVRFLQKRFHAIHVSAFRQPNATGVAAKTSF